MPDTQPDSKALGVPDQVVIALARHRFEEGDHNPDLDRWITVTRPVLDELMKAAEADLDAIWDEIHRAVVAEVSERLALLTDPKSWDESETGRVTWLHRDGTTKPWEVVTAALNNQADNQGEAG